MPTAPKSLQDALGPEASQALSRFVIDTVQDNAVPRGEYHQLVSRLDTLEETVDLRFDHVNGRLDRIENHLSQIDNRFDQMSAQFDQRLDQMSAQFDNRFDQMNMQSNGRFDRLSERIDAMTRWTVGTIALFGTIFAILMAIATSG